MKRLLLYATATVVFMLVSNSVFGAQATISPVSAFDLASITAGICQTCGSNPTPPQPAPPPRVLATEWRIIRQTDTPPRQLSYSIEGEYVNTSRYPQPITERLSDNCRRIVTSGGVGISTSLSVNIGTTYHCATVREITFTMPPYSRTKMYRGEMRYFTDYEAAVVQIWSDGREEATARRDYGVQRHDFTRYNPVSNPN